jgi:ribosomal protein S18 acetylase RimI-like enzyme
MSAKLHLATLDDMPKLLPLVAAFHADHKISRTDDERQNSLVPLLEGSPHGAVYVIGPRKSPVGYLVISFGYSLEMAGIDGFLDEFYIRPAVRGRGMGSEALVSLLKGMSQANVKAIHLEVLRSESSAKGLYRRLGFEMRDEYCLMTRAL